MKKYNIKELMKEIPVIMLALRHRSTPLSAKILAWITIIYALSPIDLIPDFIPFIGYLDDLIILPVLITATIKKIPKEVMESCREDAEKISLKKKWLYSIPVILLWICILILILDIIFAIF